MATFYLPLQESQSKQRINGKVSNILGFPGGSGVKIHLPMQETQETWVQALGWEDLLEKKMATHSSILASRIPWKEEPGGLQSMGL